MLFSVCFLLQGDKTQFVSKEFTEFILVVENEADEAGGEESSTTPETPSGGGGQQQSFTSADSPATQHRVQIVVQNFC